MANQFIIKTNKEVIEADKLIIATGGKSYSGTGSTGDGYKFAKKFGHTIKEIKASLVPLEVIEKEECKSLQGLSLKNVSMKPGKTGTMEVVVNTPSNYTAFQFDLTLPKGVSSTVRATYDLYQEELTVDEIAKKRKLTVSTIYEHFSQLVGMGAVSIYELLSKSKIRNIALAIKKVGGDRLSEIKSHCTSSITYDDIKLMLSHFRKRRNRDKGEK